MPRTGPFDAVVRDTACWWAFVKDTRSKRRLGPFKSAADATAAFEKEKHSYANHVPEGVRWDYDRGMWRVAVLHEGKRVAVGAYKRLTDARLAHRRAAAKLKRKAALRAKQRLVELRAAQFEKVQAVGAAEHIRLRGGKWVVRLPARRACSQLGAYEDVDTAIDIYLKAKAAREGGSA